MSLTGATQVRRAKPGVYVAEVPSGWDIAGATNGGLMLAIATRAVLEETGDPDPLTVTAHYFAPAQPGPVRIHVEVIRTGNRLRTSTVRLETDSGEVLLAMLATTTVLGTPGAEDLSGQTLVAGQPPSLPRPEECLLVEPTDTFPPPFMGNVDVRLPPDVVGFALGKPMGRAEMRGWFSLPEGEPLGSLGALLASDAFPPPVFNAALPINWTPTVELTVQVRSRPASSRLRCTFRSRFVEHGLLEVDGELWDESDHLVALSRQLALVPR